MKHLDLSGNNILPMLLEERTTLRALSESTNRRLKEVNAIIRESLGDATSASLSGWEIEIRTHHRREYTVDAMDVTSLFAKRVADEE